MFLLGGKIGNLGGWGFGGNTLVVYFKARHHFKVVQYFNESLSARPADSALLEVPPIVLNGGAVSSIIHRFSPLHLFCLIYSFWQKTEQL